MTLPVSTDQWLPLLPEPAVVVSRDGEVLGANEPFARLFAENSLAGFRLEQLALTVDGGLERQLRRWARSKRPLPGSLRLNTREGESDFVVEGGRLSPPVVTDGPVAMLIRCKPRAEAIERFRVLREQVDALTREILARRRAEAEALEQRERLRIVLGSIGDAVLATDCDQRITFLNQTAERLTGWSTEAAHGRPFTEVMRLVHEHTGEPARNPCEEVIGTRRVVELANHTVLISRDGQRYIIEDSAAPILDAQWNLHGVVIVFRDTTRQKEAERRIREQQEWFRTTLSSIGDAVLATDAEGRVNFLNAVAEELTGWSSQSARGRDSVEVFNIVNEETRRPVESPVTRVLREGTIVGLANHTVLIARDGREVPIDDSGAPIFGRGGELLGAVLVFRDISERHAAEQVRARLAAIVEHSNDAIVGKDLDGIVTEWNHAAERLFGYTANEMIGRSIKLLIPAERLAEEDRILRAIRQGQRIEPYQTRRMHKSGRLVDVSLAVSPIKDEYGRVVGAAKIARDIGPQKQAEQALQSSLERERARAAELETLMEFVPAVVFVAHDPECLQITGNRKAYEFYRLPAGTNLSKEPQAAGGPAPFRIFQNGRELAPEELPAQRAVRGEHVDQEEFEIRFGDGSVAYLIGSAVPLRDGRGGIRGALAALIDITARKRSEQALSESEERFRTMADSAPVLIWMSDTHGKCTYLNRQWLEFAGRSAEEELGDGWVERMHAGDRLRFVNVYRHAFEAREPFRTEYRLRRYDGEYRWMITQGAPRYSPNGSFLGYVGSSIDISERRQAERQLQTLNEELEKRVDQRTAQLRELTQELTRAEQRERQRLARVLHDNLQQLLVAARMRMELMGNRATDPELVAMAKHAQDLIGRSIDASRTMTLELSPPVLYDGGLCAALPWLGRQMGQSYQLEVETQTDSVAEPRDEEMRLALFFAARELLFNIVKHAQASRAVVSLTRAEDGHVALKVTDNGVGFDPKRMRTSGDGTGFGLFSLRERIEFMGGRVHIESSPGGGASIEILTPQRGSIAHSPPSVQAVARHRMARGKAELSARPVIRVLLVDDHKIVREGIAGILEEYADIELIAEAADGQEAVELAQQHVPDVVVMDVTLPKLNGVEATRLITRALPEVRVVGLSMHDSEDIARSMIEAGAVCMLAKDGPSDALVQALRASRAK